MEMLAKATQYEATKNRPKLKVNNPLDAVLWHIAVVEQSVGDAGDSKEYQARRHQKEGA